LKFSIITICYNSGDKLKAAIDSVLSQKGVDIEYIIVDGASTDGTVEYVSSLNGISNFISEPDDGLYDALNKGVRFATGDVVGFVHGDDLLADSTVVSRVAECFASSGADAVYGDLEYVAKDDTSKVIRYWKSGKFDHSWLKFGWMPPHPALYIKREIYERAKLPNGDYFDLGFTCSSDYDFMMRLLGRMKISIAYIPLVLVRMRVGGISNKDLKHLVRKSREDLNAMRRNKIGGFGTLLAKNLRKLPQFFKRLDYS